MNERRIKGQLAEKSSADADDFARQTERLEAALDRIAAVAQSQRLGAVPQASHRPAADASLMPAEAVPEHVMIDTAAVTGRLDSLIARLRAVIGEV
jgi:hypothetical protein